MTAVKKGLAILVGNELKGIVELKTIEGQVRITGGKFLPKNTYKTMDALEAEMYNKVIQNYGKDAKVIAIF